MEIALKNLARVCISAVVIGLFSACGGASDPIGNAAPSAAANISAKALPGFLPTTEMPPNAQTIAIQMEGGRLNSEELAQAAKTGVLSKPFDGLLLSGAEDLSNSIGNNSSSVAPSLQPRISALLRAVSLTQAYRFYNPRTTAHFFTTNTAERAYIIANLPFMNDEGPAFYTSNAMVAGLSPVHRFYNTQTGVHFFTISENERAKVAAELSQYNYEGIAYYASQLAGTGLTPLHRFYHTSKGFHFFTSDIAERNNIIATLPKYKYEGVGYYVMSSGWQAPDVPSTDTTAPTFATLAAISPLNGTVATAYATTTTFTANESLSVASIKMTCDGVDSPGTTSVSGAVATFTPAAPGYAASAKCTATVNAAGTKDLAGNAFASNVSITNFTVKALNCTDTTSNVAPSFNGTALVAVCGNVFVDPTVAKNQHPVIIEAVSFAVQNGKSFYGTLTSSQADVIVCSTQACGAYFAGPSLRNVAIPSNSFAGQYTAPRMTVVLTSATANRNPNILAHEFSHVETNARLNNAFIPAWFNEGLATYVGGEPVCTNVAGKGISSLLSLNLQADWNVYTGTTETFEKTYCQARAEVAAWIYKRGSGAVNTLFLAVSQGQTFTSQYGPMQTQ